MPSFRRIAHLLGCASALAVLAACSNTPVQPSSGHLNRNDAPAVNSASIPAPVQATVLVPKPRAVPKVETYSVVVNNVRVQELLFALARDARINIDVHPGINGTVTLNAIDQTLQQLLQRISKQVDMRWELDGANLSVMPDTPYLRTYKVDYVNMSRDATGAISANSQINTSVSPGGASSSSGGNTGNLSITRVENKISNHFWESLERNIKDLLRETDKILPGGDDTVGDRNQQAASRTTAAATAAQAGGTPQPAAPVPVDDATARRVTYREAASVIVNPETGIVSVRATSRQHEKIQEFIDQVTNSARRQVMIEVTVVEVELNDAYRQGIQWSKLDTTPGLVKATPTIFKLTTDFAALSPSYSGTGSVLKTVQLLEQFGDVKVLSSPKLSVLNNQSALLKVVENFVYFSVKADIAAGTVLGGAATKAFTTTPQSVSVGLVMAVTPQISENNSITLNVRPSISSVVRTVPDPNPDLTVPNLVPVIRTREMESVLRVEDGEIAVLGGLMEDKIDYSTNRLPVVGAIPLLGEIFTARDNTTRKSELVVFLRPTVIRDPSVAGDYKNFREYLPSDTTMSRPPHSLPFELPRDRELQK